MPEQQPGWFYVGNGQLRYKDGTGWTDQYQDLDGPKRASEAEPPASPDVPAQAVAKVPRVRGKRILSTFIRRCTTTAYRSIAARFREASARSSSKAIARRPRHRGSLSTSSVVLSQFRHASLARQLRVHKDPEEANDSLQ